MTLTNAERLNRWSPRIGDYVIKTSDRGPRLGKLRLWTPPDRPAPGVDPATMICVEWAGGMVGHPSTYGLLGGREARGETESPVDLPLGRFPASLAGTADVVEFGLPTEFERVVLDEARSRIVVTVAAHGLVGSSPLVFGGLTRMLLWVLEHGIPTTDEETCAAWNAAKLR